MSSKAGVEDAHLKAWILDHLIDGIAEAPLTIMPYLVDGQHDAKTMVDALQARMSLMKTCLDNAFRSVRTYTCVWLL